MDFLTVIYYFLYGAFGALITPIPILMFIYILYILCKDYNKNEKSIWTKGIKIAIVIILLFVILGGFLYVWVIDFSSSLV